MRFGVKLRFNVRAVVGSASEWEICEGRYNKCSNTRQYNTIQYSILDNLQRFLSLRSLAATFSALLPAELLDAFDDEHYPAAKLLANQCDAVKSLIMRCLLDTFNKSSTDNINF